MLIVSQLIKLCIFVQELVFVLYCYISSGQGEIPDRR